MKEEMTINELIQKAHANAVVKGFWDNGKNRNMGELIMLIVSECGEALEAHRKGKRFNKLKHDMFMASISVNLITGEYMAPLPEKEKQVFESCVKDTFEDELADVVIRIADLMGWMEEAYFVVINQEPIQVTDNVGDSLLNITEVVSNRTNFNAFDNGNRAKSMVIDAVFALAKMHGIDLWKHIELKMQYNETRERLHGKAY